MAQGTAKAMVRTAEVANGGAIVEPETKAEAATRAQNNLRLHPLQRRR
jgi:hypothetical protein